VAQLETPPVQEPPLRDNGAVSKLLAQPRFLAPGALPRGPHSLTRAQVAANQRGRMLEGMIDAVGEKGYAASTVSDVIKRAGVSRKAFYEHFANKDECFLATHDSIAAIGRRGVSTAFHGAEGLSDGVQRALGDVFDLAIARPQALRVLMVEIGAARPAGSERRERLVVGYEDVLRESLGLQRGPGPIPNPVLRGVVGGILHVLYARLRQGERERLRELLPELVRWATAYWPAPAAMMDLVDATPPEPNLAGGRAPGSLSLGASANRRRRLPRGEGGSSKGFVLHSQRERVLDAVANITVRGGYAALTVEGIAAEASVSLQAFYEHFGTKEEAFLVAYEIGHDKALALVEQAYASQPDWRYGVRAGITALFGFLACEPTFAHMAMVDVRAATERSTECAFRGANTFAHMLLLPGLDHAPADARPPAVTAQAITGGLFELALHHALQRRIHELPAMVPRATYFALAPFIGAEAAGAVATAPREAPVR
jgi:AcrR family transcriptional regulator